MRCTNCGTDNRSGVTQCVACGSPLVEFNDPFQVSQPGSFQFQSSAQSSKNKTTAAVLALFFGSLGLQKFYLGQPGKGILYILFFWTMIPSILSVIEAIQFFSMSQEDFASKYP